MIDGTWRQARHMLRHSPELAALERVARRRVEGAVAGMARSSARNPRGDATEAPGEDKAAQEPRATRALACALVRTRRAAPERQARETRDAGVETSAEGIVAHRVVT